VHTGGGAQPAAVLVPGRSASSSVVMALCRVERRAMMETMLSSMGARHHAHWRLATCAQATAACEVCFPQMWAFGCFEPELGKSSLFPTREIRALPIRFANGTALHGNLVV